MKTQGTQFLKKRKFLMMLPLLTLPFITLAFWAMGGGKTEEVAMTRQQGLNPELPDAKLPGGPFDKMSLYNQAAKDSLAKRQQQGFSPVPDTARMDFGAIDPSGNFYSGGQTSSGSGLRTYTDPNEAKVRDRLASLEQALREPTPGANPYASAGGYDPTGASSMRADLDRLEQMMQSMSSGAGKDPEVQQLNDMMEKVLDLQYPERAQQKLQETSRKNKGRVYPVNLYQQKTEAGILSRPEQGTTIASPIPASGNDAAANNAFYSLSANSVTDTLQTAIPAVVHETQTLVSGSTIKLRLTEDIFVSGTLIPAGNFIFGTCSVNGERLAIEIGGVRYGKSLFPVALTVYDFDALKGIRIPGAITRDAAKEGADRAMQGIQLTTLDPSLAAQTAGVGVEVAKGLFGKKAKLIRVTVKAGYPVLLMDAKTMQEQAN